MVVLGQDKGHTVGMLSMLAVDVLETRLYFTIISTPVSSAHCVLGAVLNTQGTCRCF